MGTGGALKFSLSKLPERFFLLNGDSFLRLDYKAMQDQVEKCHKRASVAIYNNLDPTPVPNNLKFTSGQLSSYKKNAGRETGYNFVDAGVYIFDREIIEVYPAARFDLGDLMSSLISNKNIDAFEVPRRFYDIGTLDRLKEFEGALHDYF